MKKDLLLLAAVLLVATVISQLSACLGGLQARARLGATEHVGETVQ